MTESKKCWRDETENGEAIGKNRRENSEKDTTDSANNLRFQLLELKEVQSGTGQNTDIHIFELCGVPEAM